MATTYTYRCLSCDYEEEHECADAVPPLVWLRKDGGPLPPHAPGPGIAYRVLKGGDSNLCYGALLDINYGFPNITYKKQQTDGNNL